MHADRFIPEHQFWAKPKTEGWISSPSLASEPISTILEISSAEGQILQQKTTHLV